MGSGRGCRPRRPRHVILIGLRHHGERPMGYVGFARMAPGRIELLVPTDSLHRRALRSTRSSEASPSLMYCFCSTMSSRRRTSQCLSWCNSGGHLWYCENLSKMRQSTVRCLSLRSSSRRCNQISPPLMTEQRQPRKECPGASTMKLHAANLDRDHTHLSCQR